MRQGLILRIVIFITISMTASVSLSTGCRKTDSREESASVPDYADLEIAYPYDGAVFPPESIPPKFSWHSQTIGVNQWRVRIDFNNEKSLEFKVSSTEWRPDSKTWKRFKTQSTSMPARVTVEGFASKTPNKILESGTIALSTSKDPVDASLFYREVPLPFIDAVKDPARIRWRFGRIDSSTQPKVVLENLPVCGNCHSFSQDGSVLGMDVDYANDKGSYVLTNTAKQMDLTKADVITWSDYKKEDKQPTFGLLSQVSPNGRYAVSTVKDRSVFVPKPDLAFSQLFFPLKGILAVYDKETGEFKALPGADDPAYVHSNPTWSPDGKHIVFARAEAYELTRLTQSDKAILTAEECREFLEEGKLFRFDLYRIPFKDGAGGTPVPIKGASNNKKSNYFAKYSPDGKWIVFCQSNSFMLLQSDSELFIIPANGGEARRLKANRNQMNSWHSWSPNGKWLVFASKANGPYTQLFLTHIDDEGVSAPPVVLSHFTLPDRAANIPEFVALPADGIAQIREAFIDDVSYMRTALENVKAGDFEKAEAFYQKALAINPQNAEAHATLGGLLTEYGRLEEAYQHLKEALRLDPTMSIVHYNLGNAYTREGKMDEAVKAWEKTLALDPSNLKAQNNLGAILLRIGRVREAEKVFEEAIQKDPQYAQAHHNLGNVRYKLKQTKEAVKHWQDALRLDNTIGDAHLNLGVAMLAKKEFKRAISHLETAIRLDPYNVPAMINLAVTYEHMNNLKEAQRAIEKAIVIAQKIGRPDLQQDCLIRLQRYQSAQSRN